MSNNGGNDPQNNIPEFGVSRLTYCLKESFQTAVERNSQLIRQRVLLPLINSRIISEQAKQILEKVDPKIAFLGAAFATAAAVGYWGTGQALGLYGFAVSYMGAMMPQNRNTRTMYSLGCAFFTAQYATDIGHGMGGFISAGSAAVRGSLLTVIADDQKVLRNRVALGFFAASSVGVAAISAQTGHYENLMLLPGFGLSALADRMGDRRSHAARFLKMGAFTIVGAYDFLIADNLGSGLTSGLLFYQTIKTARREGDFLRQPISGEAVSTKSRVRTYLTTLMHDKK